MALKISDVRQYLRDRIIEIIPSAVEIDDPFGSKDVAISEIKNGYKIFFGESTTENKEHFYLDTIPTTVQIFYQDSGKAVDQFDTLYDLAHQIKDTILNPIDANNNLAFNGILGNSINVIAMPTNDRGFEATISLTCLRYTDYTQE